MHDSHNMNSIVVIQNKWSILLYSVDSKIWVLISSFRPQPFAFFAGTIIFT